MYHLRKALRMLVINMYMVMCSNEQYFWHNIHFTVEHLLVNHKLWLTHSEHYFVVLQDCLNISIRECYAIIKTVIPMVFKKIATKKVLFKDIKSSSLRNVALYYFFARYIKHFANCIWIIVDILFNLGLLVLLSIRM